MKLLLLIAAVMPLGTALGEFAQAQVTETIQTVAGTVTVKPLPGKTTEEALVAALQQIQGEREPKPQDDPRAVFALRQLGATLVLDVNGNVATLNFMKAGVQTNDLEAASRFTDAHTPYLLRLVAIRTLNISGATITNVSTPILAKVTTLSNLQIASTGVTDEGLKALAALVDLRYLDLGSCRVSGAGLKHLAPLDALLSINLTSVAIRDEDLTDLLEMPALSRVYLTGTLITDAGIPTLQKLPLLKVLSLYATRVSDVALPAVAEIPELQTLYLEKSLVTPTGVNWLKKKLPKLQVYGP